METGLNLHEKLPQIPQHESVDSQATQEISEATKVQCEAFKRELDTEGEKKLVDSWLSKYDEAEVRKRLLEWRPANEKKHSAMQEAKKNGISAANDRVQEIWEDKNLNPQEKAKKFEEVLVAIKAFREAENKIKSADLAPARKKVLREMVLADMFKYYEPHEIPKIIAQDIYDVAINQGRKVYEQITKEREEMKKMLSKEIDGVPLFSEAEFKSQKKAISKDVYRPFLTAQKGKESKAWVMGKIKEKKKAIQKEIKERQPIAKEFAQVRKIFGSLKNKKAEKGSDLSFGKLLSEKKFNKASLKKRQEILRNIMLTASSKQFKSVYGETRKVVGNQAAGSFREAMFLAKWTKEQEAKFQKEMQAEEQKGLAKSDWAEAHQYFAKVLKKAEKMPDSNLSTEQKNKYKNHLHTCEQEMWNDVQKYSTQEELSQLDQFKVQSWQAISSTFSNPTLKTDLNQLIQKMKTESEAEKEEPVELSDTEILETMMEKGAGRILTIAAVDVSRVSDKAVGTELQTVRGEIDQQSRDSTEKKELKQTRETLEAGNANVFAQEGATTTIDTGVVQEHKDGSFSQASQRKLSHTIANGGKITTLNTRGIKGAKEQRDDLARGLLQETDFDDPEAQKRATILLKQSETNQGVRRNIARLAS